MYTENERSAKANTSGNGKSGNGKSGNGKSGNGKHERNRNKANTPKTRHTFRRNMSFTDSGHRWYPVVINAGYDELHTHAIRLENNNIVLAWGMTLTQDNIREAGIPKSILRYVNNEHQTTFCHPRFSGEFNRENTSLRPIIDHAASTNAV